MSHSEPWQAMKIGLVCEGDCPRSETAFSGTAMRMYQCLVYEGQLVTPVDASLRGMQKALVGTPALATKWLSLVVFLNVNRMARTNIVQYLQNIDGHYRCHSCSGECNLADAHRIPCMESCHSPYRRSDRSSRHRKEQYG